MTPAAEAADPPILDRYRPKDSKAAIKAVSLSTSERDAFDRNRVGTEFPQGVSRVIVWYRWEGAGPGHRFDIHWLLEDSVVHTQGEAVTKPAGTEAWVLKTTGGPLPAGNYRVELREQGAPVTSIPFRIGGTVQTRVTMLDQYRPTEPGAVIRAVSLSASDTDDFDADRIGTEFPAGVRRVVVHYLWEGARPGHRIESRWLAGDSVVATKTSVINTAKGFGVFSAGPFPVGDYRVELRENGRAVTTIPFRVVRR